VLRTEAGSPLVFDDAVLQLGQFVLGPLTFNVPRTSTCALVGPNGAGKSTLLSCVLGMRRPSSGSVRVHGRDPYKRSPDFLNSVGWIPDDPNDLIEEFTAPEYWKWCSKIRGVDVETARAIENHARDLCKVLSFDPPPGPIAGFSHGMRKKTQLVAALQHSPQLILLDEPRNGLDPISIRRLEEHLKGLSNSGRTVIAATHDLHWAERFADSVVILDHGAVVDYGGISELCRHGESLSDAFFRVIQEKI
jgi:ABC-2 type transport system ATP-binding protein